MERPDLSDDKYTDSWELFKEYVKQVDHSAEVSQLLAGMDLSTDSTVQAILGKHLEPVAALAVTEKVYSPLRAEIERLIRIVQDQELRINSLEQLFSEDNHK